MYIKVIGIGRLTKDPETRYTPSGTCVTNLSVATSNKISKKEGSTCPEGWKEGYGGNSWEITTFWRVTVWGKQAESCNQYLVKGSQIYFEAEPNGQAENGVLNPRIWTDNSGQPRASWEVTARTIKFLSTRSDSRSAQGEGQSQDTGPIRNPLRSNPRRATVGVLDSNNYNRYGPRRRGRRNQIRSSTMFQIARNSRR